MAEHARDEQGKVIEDVVAELHRRGVERGEKEYERLVAEARDEAARLVAEAQREREQLISAGRQEADRLVEAAQGEADRLLRAFLAALPDMFSRRAGQLLDRLLTAQAAQDRSPDAIRELLGRLHPERLEAVCRHFDSSPPPAFLEGLLVLALLYYERGNGFVRFEIDQDLKERLAAVLADPQLEPQLPFEFRDGIRGFSIVDDGGRRIEVSPESFKHMAEAWANDEFRRVFAEIDAEDAPP
jgi:F0F1-type ATP synthase membrane subunit b/b'